MTLQQIHATAVAVDDAGVLLLGPSGAGKSDLALRLIAAGASLIADDRVDLASDGHNLVASSPEVIKNRLEVRGLGIIQMQAIDKIPVICAIELVLPEAMPRLPETETKNFLDHKIQLFRLNAFEVSACEKVQLAVSIATGSIMIETASQPFS